MNIFTSNATEKVYHLRYPKSLPSATEFVYHLISIYREYRYAAFPIQLVTKYTLEMEVHQMDS